MREWNRTSPLNVGIFLAGFAIGTGLAFLTTDTRQPFPCVEQIGGAVVHGTAIGFLGILISEYASRGRRRSPWTGEWLGIVASALLLGTILLETPLVDGLGQRAFVLFLAFCGTQCLLSVLSAGFWLAKLFTRNRPGPHDQPPRTDILGCLTCVMAGPFILWQLLMSLVAL